MNILCPIDFSAHSLYALQYAIDLGNTLGARLHVFTAYSVPHSTGRLRSLDQDIRNAVLEDLSDVVKQIGPKITSGHAATTNVMEGNSGRAINEFAKTHDIDLIVMGTQGKGSLSNIFLGSVAKKVVDHAGVPVIAVPQPIKANCDEGTAILSLDEKEISNKKTIEFIQNFSRKIKLKLEVFHVITTTASSDVYQQNIIKLGDVIKDVKTENNEDITMSIKKHAEASNACLIMMVRRPHSFWSRLFQDSNTTTELAMTRIPIMILPE